MTRFPASLLTVPCLLVSVAFCLLPAAASAQTRRERSSSKLVYIRSASRSGDNLRLVVENVQIHTIRGFGVAPDARILLLYPYKTSGKWIHKPVSAARFGRIIAGKDASEPRAYKLAARFWIKVLRNRIIEVKQTKSL